MDQVSVRLAGRADAGSRTAELLLGIDFGGTKMAVGVADGTGRLLAHRRMPTHAERGAQQALDRALELAAALVAEVGGRLVSAGDGLARGGARPTASTWPRTCPAGNGCDWPTPSPRPSGWPGWRWTTT